MGTKKYYLAASNNGQGFVNYFDNILDNNRPGFTYILKGGPGTGKSTLLKKIGKYFESKGEDIEYFFCSSDINSLDGVKIVSKNIAIVDGTAPHSADPTLPLISGKIVDLGQFISPKVSAFSFEMEHLLEYKSFQYSLAYGYLRSLLSLQKNLLNIEKKYFNDYLYDETVRDITAKLQLENQNNDGYLRKMFISYLSGEGITYLNEKNNYTTTIFINEDKYFSSKVISKLLNTLKDCGYSVIAFYDSYTNIPIALEIKELNAFVSMSQDKPNFYNYQMCSSLEYLTNLSNVLAKKAAKAIDSAIGYHKQVESYYIKNINFLALDELTEDLITEIELK